MCACAHVFLFELVVPCVLTSMPVRVHFHPVQHANFGVVAILFFPTFVVISSEF